MNEVTYGLTRQTVDLYRQVVELGFSWSAAMESMRRLYAHNKKFALNEK